MNIDIIQEFISDIAESIKSKLGSIFGIGDTTVNKLFSQFSLSLSLTTTEFEDIIKRPCELVSRNNGKEFSLTKDVASDKILYQVNEEVSGIQRDYSLHLRFMLNHFFRLLCFLKSKFT